jgi:lipopolysaccharide transport system permease protein
MPQQLSTTTYEPITGWQIVNIRELWKYRELMYYFTWRDIKVRYKQTVLGAGWAIIQPFMMMVVFSIFFGRLAGLDSGDVPYPVFVYSGLVLWTFFANSISSAGNSVVNAGGIITKIYFPRLLVPFASIGAAVLDFSIATTLLFAMMYYYQVPITWQIFLLPIPFITTGCAAIGVGTFLAAANVSFRDFRYTIPFIVQLWMFATPTIYMQWVDTDDQYSKQGHTLSANTDSAANGSRNRIGESSGSEEAAARPDKTAWAARLMYYGNPMVGIIGFFRNAALGGILPWKQLAFSACEIAVMFACGIAYFRRVESRFADII